MKNFQQAASDDIEFIMSYKPETRDVSSSKLNDHHSIYEHGKKPVASTNKALKRKRDD
ncbi:hypothetical protein Plhal304r1_c031g0101151 [Plasmopara halstedii]